jgi:hypothetical protein
MPKRLFPLIAPHSASRTARRLALLLGSFAAGTTLGWACPAQAQLHISDPGAIQSGGYPIVTERRIYPTGTTIIYPSGVYPGHLYPQTVYPQTVYPQTVYPQTVYPQVIYPAESSGASITLRIGSRRHRHPGGPAVIAVPGHPVVLGPGQVYPGQVYPGQVYPGPVYLVPHPTPVGVTVTKRPEPRVVIDPQYGVRWQDP